MDLGVQAAEHTVKLYQPQDKAQDLTWILHCISASSSVYSCLESMNCQEAWKDCFEINSRHMVNTIDWADINKLDAPLGLYDKTAKQAEQVHQYYEPKGIPDDGDCAKGGTDKSSLVDDITQNTEMDWS